MTETAFISITIALLGIIGTTFGFFATRIMDKLDSINSNVAEMKPKVDALWEEFLFNNRNRREQNNLS